MTNHTIVPTYLKSLVADLRAVGVRELARRTKIPPSTVSLILRAPWNANLGTWCRLLTGVGRVLRVGTPAAAPRF